MSAKPVPEGFHTITPYLITDGARQLIEFISEAFHGEVVFRKERAGGSIMHAEMKIGDAAHAGRGQQIRSDASLALPLRSGLRRGLSTGVEGGRSFGL
jgi:hypothetical protein